MSQPIHIKIKIDPQPMEKWDKKTDLANWEGEGGAVHDMPSNQLPAESPVQKGDILKVLDGKVVVEEDEYFYEIRVEKQSKK